MLGFSRDPANWTNQESQDVWDIIDSGLRRFYVPPRLPTESRAHQWSFLKPLCKLRFQADTEEYDLPTDLAHIEGGLYYTRNSDWVTPRRVTITSESQVLARRSDEKYYGHPGDAPELAAVVPKRDSQLKQQGFKLIVWPTPDAEYEVQFVYFCRQRPLRDDDAVPLGGDEHAETILAAIKSAAESYLDDTAGLRKTEFLERLAASIDHDRRASSPETLGYNGNGTGRTRSYHFRTSDIITYDKFPQ